MKTPLVIVLVIVAGMLGFLTIYSQQSGEVMQAQVPTAAVEAQAPAVAGGNGPAAPAETAAPAAPAAPAPVGK